MYIYITRCKISCKQHRDLTGY